MNTLRSLLRRAAGVALLGLAPVAWGSEPAPAPEGQAGDLRLIVPSPPGGAPDLVARVLAEALTRHGGTPVVVLNMPGANGEIALRRFLFEPADGQTWLLAQDSVIVINPSFYPRESPDVLHGMTPVASVARSSFMILVHPSDTLDTFPDFMALDDATGNGITYGSGGIGSQNHLLMEDLAQRLGLPLRHIPYKGNAPAAQALVSGDIRLLMAGASAVPLARSGRLRALATTAPARVSTFPDLPSVSEFVPGFRGTAWFGLFARAEVPPDVVAAMRAQVNAVLREDAVAQALYTRGGVEPEYTAGAAFLERIADDHRRFAAIAERLKTGAGR